MFIGDSVFSRFVGESGSSDLASQHHWQRASGTGLHDHARRQQRIQQDLLHCQRWSAGRRLRRRARLSNRLSRHCQPRARRHQHHLCSNHRHWTVLSGSSSRVNFSFIFSSWFFLKKNNLSFFFKHSGGIRVSADNGGLERGLTVYLSPVNAGPTDRKFEIMIVC